MAAIAKENELRTVLELQQCAIVIFNASDYRSDTSGSPFMQPTIEFANCKSTELFGVDLTEANSLDELTLTRFVPLRVKSEIELYK